MNRLSMLAVSLALAFSLNAAQASTCTTPLCAYMNTMSDALKGIELPQPNRDILDDVKALKDATVACFEQAEQLAPAEIAGDPQVLAAFKASFADLLSKVQDLETAILLPADATDREQQIKTAIAAVKLSRRNGHREFKP